MPLTIAERKHRMPFGAQREVAAAEGVDRGYVSKVMNGEVFPKTPDKKKQLRRVQVALARKLGVTVDEAFPPSEPVQQVA
jgi:transcriptional regulator with XRE-family HTH domain